MKNLIVISVILLNLTAVFGQDLTFPGADDYPRISRRGRDIADFIPPNWRVMDKAAGDLNGDKIPDAAVVIKNTDSRFINRNANFGAAEFDTNPRMLLVLLKNARANRYELAAQTNSFIMIPDSPNMTEPFEAVKIKNGVLQLDFELFYSAGSWSITRASYKFRYLNGDFALIGADKIEAMRNTGEMEIRSYNFLTNRMKATTGNYSEDKKGVTKWKTYRAGKLRTFRTLTKPFEWEIETGYFI